jgi:hypothetical protein
MTKELELSDKQYERLVTVLEKNEKAVGRYDGLRWGQSAAFRIGKLKREIEAQAE